MTSRSFTRTIAVLSRVSRPRLRRIGFLAGLAVIVFALSRSVAAQTTGIAFESETRIYEDVYAVGDLNHDGVADLVTFFSSEKDGYGIRVRLNDGNGAFPTVDYYAATCLGALALADIDGDGNLDILATCLSGILVLQNDAAGTGHFVPHFTPAPALWPQGTFVNLIAGDINGDGKTDALLLDSVHSIVAVLPNTLGGALTPIVYSFSLPYWADTPALVDMDLDGHLDLVFGDPNSACFCICTNNGSWVFQPRVNFPCGFQSIGFAAGDVDGDGYPDVLIHRDEVGGAVEIFRNQANGTFAQPYALSGPTTALLKVSDMDNDGVADIVGVGGPLVVYHGLGGGAFSPPFFYPLESGDTAMDVAQLDHDGWRDVVCSSGGGNQQPRYITILHAAGNGRFAALPFYPAGPSPTSARLVDLDGDGDLDLVTLVGNGSLAVLRNQGDGSFTTPALYPVPNASTIATGDVDGDGDQDLVVASSAAGGSLFVFLNQGNGVLGNPLQFQGIPNSGRIALGDLDGDGRLDVVFGNGAANSISLVHQLTPLGFVLDQVIQMPQACYGLAVADLDGDGDLDLVVTGGMGLAGTSVLTNVGQGSFSWTAELASPTFGQAVCADIDGDGLPDIVTCYSWANSVGVRINRGNGAWSAEKRYQVGLYPFDVVCADFDGDNHVDVAVLDAAGGVSVLRNAGHGRLESESRVATSAQDDLVVGDVDGDGDVDLVLTHRWLGGIVIQRNLSNNGSAFCLGDGSGSQCPCGNQSSSASRSGCLNSLGSGGQLSGRGSAQLHSDSVELITSQIPNGAAMLLQSSGTVAGGAGTIFGDGLRCVGNPVQRVAVHLVTSGATAFPAVGETSLAIAGGVHSSGDKHYQVWYRDPISFCTSSAFNLTNGWTIHWTP